METTTSGANLERKGKKSFHLQHKFFFRLLPAHLLFSFFPYEECWLVCDVRSIPGSNASSFEENKTRDTTKDDN
jgi:hypothetical protein